MCEYLVGQQHPLSISPLSLLSLNVSSLSLSLQLPSCELRSTYARHVNRVFKQDRTVVNLGRASPFSPPIAGAFASGGEKLRPILESEFGHRLSTYDASPDDLTAKDDAGVASFKSMKEFSVPGKYRSSARDRTSLLRSAHLAQEPLINLRPKTSEFALNRYASHASHLYSCSHPLDLPCLAYNTPPHMLTMP